MATNIPEIENLFKKAEDGDVIAQYKLGWMYGHGQGVAKDEKAACEWYRFAAEQGHPASQLELGRMYKNGFGVAKDERIALKWFRCLATISNTAAINEILVIIERKIFLFRDLMETDKDNIFREKDAQELGFEITKHFIRQGNIKVLKELCNIYPDLFKKILVSTNRFGMSAMHIAAFERQVLLINFLKDRGCDLNAQDYHGETPFFVAIKEGGIAFAQSLLQHISQENLNQVLECSNIQGHTSLHAALNICRGVYRLFELDHEVSNDTSSLEFLLKYKPNLNHQDNRGRSVLHLAVQYHHIKALEILLNQHSADLDLNLVDEEGRTVLHLAAERGFVPAIQLLCSGHAYLEALDNKNRTPLHCAIESTTKTRLDAVNTLLRFGANIRGALELAERLNHGDVVGCLRNFSLAQGKPVGGAGARIKNLVFQGGSVKGIAYFGALEALVRQQIISLKEIERVGGTSAGSITAVLLAVGYTLPEVEALLSRLDFKEFLDNPAGGNTSERENFLRIKKIIEEGASWFRLGTNINSIRDLFAKVTEKYGLFQGDYLRLWMEDRIKDKTKINNTTFREHAALCERHGLEKFKHLYLVGTNASTGRAEVFSHEHTPEMIIADALRISVSIPVLFMPHCKFIKNPAGQRVKGTNDLYIDGGVSDNYPVWLFDNSRYLGAPKKEMKERAEGFAQLNPETLGFRLVSYKTKQTYEQGAPLEARDVNGFFQFLLSIANCYMEKQESDHSRIREDRERSIYIDTLGISMLAFDLKEEDKRNLKNAGFRAAHEYVERAKLSRQKITLSPSLIAALLFAARNPLVVNGEKGLEIQHIVLNPQRIPRLIYKFYAKGTPEEIAFLESLSIQFNAQNIKKNSAVHLAVRFDNIQCLEKLLSKKLHLDMVNADGKTALDLACEKSSGNQRRMVKALVEAGACRVRTGNISKVKATLEPLLEFMPELKQMLAGLKTSEQPSSPLRVLSGGTPKLEEKQRKEGISLEAGVDFGQKEHKGALDVSASRTDKRDTKSDADTLNKVPVKDPKQPFVISKAQTVTKTGLKDDDSKESKEKVEFEPSKEILRAYNKHVDSELDFLDDPSSKDIDPLPYVLKSQASAKSTS